MAWKKPEAGISCNTQNNTDHLRKHASSLCFYYYYKDSKPLVESRNTVLEKVNSRSQIKGGGGQKWLEI